MIPEQRCKFGYPWKQAVEIIGADREKEFTRWMIGQTMALCGPDSKDQCRGHHGTVVYRWDLERFLAGLPVTD